MLQINQAELDILKSFISNEAKVLYVLGLRKDANTTTGASAPINYKELCPLVSTKDVLIKQGRQINSLVRELRDVGLISVAEHIDLKHTLQGKTVNLPLMIVSDDTYMKLHNSTQAMTIDWLPDPKLYDELAQLIGLVDKTYTKEMVGDFVAYWLGRPHNQFTLFQWTQKFVLQRKQQLIRHTQATTAVTRVGLQTKVAEASVETDAKTKALVAKYKTKTGE